MLIKVKLSCFETLGINTALQDADKNEVSLQKQVVEIWGVLKAATQRCLSSRQRNKQIHPEFWGFRHKGYSLWRERWWRSEKNRWGRKANPESEEHLAWPQEQAKRSSLPGEDLNLWAACMFYFLLFVWFILGTEVTTWLHHHFLLPLIRAVNETLEFWLAAFSRRVTSTMVFAFLLYVAVIANPVCLAFYSLLQGFLKYSVEKLRFIWQDGWGQLPASDLILTPTLNRRQQASRQWLLTRGTLQRYTK